MMREPRRLYLCGPVTGVPDLNRPAFDEAAETLREAGYAVLVPHDAVPAHARWQDAMRICIAAMLGCDGVALIDGWERSRGAAVEIDIARKVGMTAFSAGYLAAVGNAENVGRKADGRTAELRLFDELEALRDLRIRRDSAED